MAAETSSAQSQATIDKIQSNFAERINEADLKIKVQSLKNLITENDNMIKSGKLTDEEIKYKKKENANYQRYIDSVVRMNNSSANRSNSEAYGQDLQNEITEDTKEDAKTLFHSDAFISVMKTVPTDVSSVVKHTIAKIHYGEYVSFEERASCEERLRWLYDKEYTTKNNINHEQAVNIANRCLDLIRGGQ